METTIDTTTSSADIQTQEAIEPTIVESLEAMEKDLASSSKLGSGKRPVKEILAGFGKFRPAVIEHAKYLLAIVLPLVHEFLETMRKENLTPEQLQEPSDVQNLTWGETIARLKMALEKLYTSSLFEIRRVAHLSLLRFRLTQDNMSQEEISETFEWASKEYLSPEGTEVRDGFGFSKEDRQEILRLIGGIRKEYLKNVKKQEAGKKPPIVVARVDTPITAIQAWNGDVGEFVLDVPPNGDKGGKIVLQNQSGILHVVSANNGYGDLENASIPLTAIKTENCKIRDELAVSPPPAMDGEKLAKWQFRTERLGKALKRGFQALLVSATRELEPWHFLSGNDAGTAVLTFKGNFEWEPYHRPADAVTISNLSLRFTRREDGQIALTEIISKGREAFDLFSVAIGKYCAPGEEAFEDLQPVQCKVFLKLMFGQHRQEVLEKTRR